jgi:hypothetical protein
MHRSALLAALGISLTALACEPPPLGKVGDTMLAQAADTRELSEGPAATIELSKLDLKALPAESEVRLAIGKRVLWREVRDTVTALEKAGKKVVLLSAQRRRIGAFALYDEVGPRPIDVVTRTDGTACVRLPGVKEAKCVQRADAMHIDRAHLRQLTREAVRKSKIKEAVVYVPPDMQWADVVRSVDAVRTCCKESLRPKAKLIDLETRKKNEDEPETILVDAPE